MGVFSGEGWGGRPCRLTSPGDSVSPTPFTQAAGQQLACNPVSGQQVWVAGGRPAAAV